MNNNNNKIFSNIILKIDNLNAYITNGYLEVFVKMGYVSKLLINKINIINNLENKKTFYLDWNGGKSVFYPNKLFINKYNNDIAHISYIMNLNDNLEIEYHFIIRKFIKGIYNYVVINNSNNLNNNKLYTFSEIRVVYRFDYSIMNILYNGLLNVKSHLYSDLKKNPLVQDETWQLYDGSYYSKYDLAGYIRQTKYYGVYGKEYGAWLINFSHEYFSGGPLKQDLLVHQDSLMLNYLHSTHFGTPELCIPVRKWQKIYGPWLIYLNNNINLNLNLLTDVNIFFKKEIHNWPFKWLEDKNYNINRKKIYGNIKNINNKKYQIILSSSLDEEFDKQTLGYLYHTINLNDGSFKIKNIIPNKYMLYIYPLNGVNNDFLFKKIVNLNDNLELINLNIKDNNTNNVIWNIGETSRTTSGFKYSNKNRNFIWHILSPKNLKFVIDNNKVNIKKWYYAQTKKGVWKIYFNDLYNKKDRILNIGVCGASNNVLQKQNSKPYLKIYVNDIFINEFIYENDKSIYRGALKSGNYYNNKINISHKYIINGLNILKLKLIGGSIMYDCLIYCQK